MTLMMQNYLVVNEKEKKEVDSSSNFDEKVEKKESMEVV